MKKIITVVLALAFTFAATAQETLQGFYYLPTPLGDIWGVGFHKPVKGNDLSYAGTTINVDSHDLLTLPAPQSSEKVLTTLTNMAFTSLFQKNKAITYSVSSYRLNEVVLSAAQYENFNKGSYYVTQALQADSVVIKGKINRSLGSSSADAEKILALFLKPATVIFKIISAFSGKDSTKQTGIVHYSNSQNDSFTLIITNPEVYFAVKLTSVTYYDKTSTRVERGLPGGNIRVATDDDPTEILSWHYEINRGLDVGIRFRLEKGYGIAKIWQQYYGKPESVLAVKKKPIANSPVHFALDGSTITPKQVAGKSKATDFLIRLYTEFTFNPATNIITIDGNEGGPFKTGIDHVEGTYTTWPN